MLRLYLSSKRRSMKKIAIIILLAIPCLIHSRDWSTVVASIAHVESNGDASAVNGDAVGLLQIRPVLVKDVNRILKKRKSNKRYSLKDRYNARKSREMFEIYQSYYNPNGSVERAIRLWNGGCGDSISGTQKYYNKVKKAMQ